VNGSLLEQMSSANYPYIPTNPPDLCLSVLPGAVSPQSEYAFFSTNWSTNLPGFYTFTATLTDAYGHTNGAFPVTVTLTNNATATNLVVAAINKLSETPTGLGTTVYPVVTQGLFALQGSAEDPGTTNPVSYQVLVFPRGDYDTPLVNATPQPWDASGFRDGAVTNGNLGLCDFTTLPNGIYDLMLVVNGGANETNAIATFVLDTPLKLGQFSFSEQDIVLPVNGIPLTVTRTYNSLNPLSSDFGYGWSFAINDMDVQLDDQRQDVTIDGIQAMGGGGGGGGGLPPTVSVRTGGDWDVTLTLPNGRRTTFVFNPTSGFLQYFAGWNTPPDLPGTTLAMNGDPTIQVAQNGIGNPFWNSAGPGSTFVNNDVPGWVLTTQDGTKYNITRGQPQHIVWDKAGDGNYIYVTAYGTPTLTSIVDRNTNTIAIGSSGITNFAPNGSLIRQCLFQRDSQGRITAIYDPNSQAYGSQYPALQYIYDQDTGNLIQVLKLVDASVGTYVTNHYDYNNQQFPHYITSIENASGAPLQSYYDANGRVIATVNAIGATNRFIYNTNNTEVTIDPRGNPTTYLYDLNGNILAKTNALGQVELMAYDANNNKTNDITCLNGQPYATNVTLYDQNNLLTNSVNPLGATVTYAYNAYAEVTNTVDALNNRSTNYYDGNGNLVGTSDALGNTTTNFYNSLGLLIGSRDAVGTLTTNSYDPYGSLISTATLNSSGTVILSTNTFAYDANGNRTNSTVWRVVGVAWIPSVTSYTYDAQNRIIQTINPDDGTNTVIYTPTGQQQATIDPLGHTNSYYYDALNRLIQTVYPDGTSTSSAYDANGNRTDSVDQLARVTTYVYDALNRLTNTIYPDLSTSTTIYDGVGRVQYSVDARGFTTAFGYDLAGERIAVTNAWGTSVAMTNLYGFDANGNQITFTNSLGRVTTNVYDALNRQVEVLYADGTKTLTGYDADGRKVASTNQDNVVTRFAYDGAGRLIAVTDALTNITSYGYDQAGNQTNQMDALGRMTVFTYDGMGRRITRKLPGGQTETNGYDVDGNLVYATNFNGVIITNQYDLMNRLVGRTSVNGYQIGFAYDAAGNRTNMTDPSGVTAYGYDSCNRLLLKTNAFSGGLGISLTYGYDLNGNVTNIHSSTPNGVNLQYAYDPLNRITNVLSSGAAAATYGFDGNGNLQSVRYGNGVTNLYQYDALSRLTNSIWKSNAITMASFYYQLGATGNRTNLKETISYQGVSTTNIYVWQYDRLYRLTNEAINGLGTLAYGLDSVGNRTNRTTTGSPLITQLPTVNNTFNSNDWINTDRYDSNGNTLTNANSQPYYYDVANRLTNYNNAVYFGYNGDGIRMAKNAHGTNTFYLVDDRNPSGYVQVLEEWTVSGGSTNLATVYAYGLALVSQTLPNASTNYFGTDGHGSARFLLDDSGNVSQTLTYDAYGTLVSSQGTITTLYRYCGEQCDPDLGFYYLRARYMNANTGRFWTMDTHEGDPEDPLSLHRYLYCTGNPINEKDPRGLDANAPYPTLLDAVKEAANELWYLECTNQWEYFAWLYTRPSTTNVFYMTPHTDHDPDGVLPDNAPPPSWPYNIIAAIHSHPSYWYDFGYNEDFSRNDKNWSDQHLIPFFLVNAHGAIKEYNQGTVTVIQRAFLPGKVSYVRRFAQNVMSGILTGDVDLYNTTPF
jgi:RHS repeat-associated protein